MWWLLYDWIEWRKQTDARLDRLESKIDKLESQVHEIVVCLKAMTDKLH